MLEALEREVCKSYLDTFSASILGTLERSEKKAQLMDCIKLLETMSGETSAQMSVASEALKDNGLSMFEYFKVTYPGSELTGFLTRAHELGIDVEDVIKEGLMRSMGKYSNG